jgi:hypothetical protein
MDRASLLLVKSLKRIMQHSIGLSHCIFAAVLLLRLLVLVRLTGSPFLLPKQGDMHFYNDWAQRILHGELTDHLAFYGLPLYAYFLAILYKIFGYSPFVPGFLQACLDAGTAVILYQTALRVFHTARFDESRPPQGRLWTFVTQKRAEIIGVISALGWAFFVPAQAYSVVLMPSAWLVFVFWIVVWRIVRNDRAPSLFESACFGLLIGVTAMGTATILFLLPLILAALLRRPDAMAQFRRRRIIPGMTLLFAGVAAGTSPCWVHNYFIARDPVFLSAHSGINLWIGNNPAANGYPNFPPGLHAGQAAMLRDSINGAEAATGRSLKRSEVSAYWSEKAKAYIRERPRDWLKLLAIKARNFWNAFQYDDLSVITNLREQGIILPGLMFGFLAALAIPGVLLALPLAPKSRWIFAAVLLHMTSLLAVFVTERYRMAAVPGLILFGAFGLTIFWMSCATGNWRNVAIYLAFLFFSALFVGLPQRDPSLWALDSYNSGWQALESENLTLAEKKLGLAYTYVPDNPETNFALGNLRLAQGNTATAKSFYYATLIFDPEHKGALNNLGVLALQENHAEEAEDWFRKALAQDPRNAKTHYLLAKTLCAAGDRHSASLEIEKAIQLSPSQSEFTELRESIRQQH